MAVEGGRQMKRLTSNKNTSDMSMIELAHNSCYIDNKRNARYRDYNLDIDSRQLAKDLVEDMCDEDLSDMSDEEFDEYMSEMRSVEMDSQIGLLALFYRNLWVMADLREKLKEYEDLEEQGRLVQLPCKVGDTVYHVVQGRIVEVSNVDLFFLLLSVAENRFNNSVFLTKSEAEAKLKELRGEQNGKI